MRKNFSEFYFLTLIVEQQLYVSSINYKHLLIASAVIVITVGLALYFGGPSMPPDGSFIIENIANTFDVPIAPAAGVVVSALVEGFDDGTFAPSSAVVPLNGAPDAFLAPDSPVAAVTAYYETFNCIEPQVLNLYYVALAVSFFLFVVKCAQYLMLRSDKFFMTNATTVYAPSVLYFTRMPASTCSVSAISLTRFVYYPTWGNINT